MKKLLRKLIQAETTVEKGELAAARIICEEFSDIGIKSHIDNWDGNRANITATIKTTGRKAGLLFVCHLDVVPSGEAEWKYPPFGGVESDGKIHGRGSADMKGPITAVITAIKQIVNSGTNLEGDVIFFAGAGEETDGCGAKRLLRSWAGQSPQLAGVVVPEPTNFDIIIAHRGVLWLEVSTKGETAHGSMPHLGVNAITSMKAILDELENYKTLFEPQGALDGCSMSINTISGGKVINVVPDECKIGIDIRTTAGKNHQDIINDFQEMFVKLKQKNSEFEAEVSVAREMGALQTDKNCDFVKGFCSAVGISQTKSGGFTTDGPHFASRGTAVIVFGPGKAKICHKPDEYIDISDVEEV